MSRRLRLQSVQLANTGRDSGGAVADAIMFWEGWNSQDGRGIAGVSFCPFDVSLGLLICYVKPSVKRGLSDTSTTSKQKLKEGSSVQKFTNNSKRPVDALAVKTSITHLLTT